MNKPKKVIEEQKVEESLEAMLQPKKAEDAEVRVDEEADLTQKQDAAREALGQETVHPPGIVAQAEEFLRTFGIDPKGRSPKEVMNLIEAIRGVKEETTQVLSRGKVLDAMDRLLSFVPEGFVGEFRQDNDVDVARAKSLGFRVFNHPSGSEESSTGTSDGTIRLGELILMIIPEAHYAAQRLAKAENLARRRRVRDKTIEQGFADPRFPLIKL